MILDYIDSIDTFCEEVGDLFEDHFNSCEEYRSVNQTLSLNKDMYQMMIDMGNMNLYIIREDETIVGYINISINLNPLYNKVQAVIDQLYIKHEYRQSGYTTKCLSEIEEVLKGEEVYDISIMLPNKEYSDRFADSVGYNKTSSIYSKYLGDN